MCPLRKLASGQGRCSVCIENLEDAGGRGTDIEGRRDVGRTRHRIVASETFTLTCLSK